MHPATFGATNLASQATLLAFEHLTMKDPSMRTDLLPGNEKVVRREPMNAAERLVEHGDHVDDEPDEHGEHAARHEVGRPAEVDRLNVLHGPEAGRAD